MTQSAVAGDHRSARRAWRRLGQKWHLEPCSIGARGGDNGEERPAGAAGSARRDPLQLLVIDVVDKRSHGDGVLRLQGVGIGVVVDDDGLVQRAAGGR